GLLGEAGRLGEPGARLAADGAATGTDELRYPGDTGVDRTEPVVEPTAGPGPPLLELAGGGQRGGQRALGLGEALESSERVPPLPCLVALLDGGPRLGDARRDDGGLGSQPCGVLDVGADRGQCGVEPLAGLGQVLPGAVDGVEEGGCL